MTHSNDDKYHVYHNWGERELVTSIGIVLVKATDGGMDNLGTPLYEVVDVDALEALLRPQNGEDTTKQVCFTIDENTVTVSNHTDLAHIIVRPNETTSNGLLMRSA